MMEYPKLSGPSKNGVFSICIGDGENRITFGFIDRMMEIFDKIGKHTGPTACILYGKGRIFSNGLDFEELASSAVELLLSFHRLLTQILTLPYPSIAAVNGHAFAGGAMMALVCDYRVMNIERGFLCINEVDIGLPLTPGMCAVIKSKIERSLWVDVCLGGKRWTGRECVDKRIVHTGVQPGQVLQEAEKLANNLSPKGANKFVYGSIKQEMYKEEIETLQTGLGHANEAARILREKAKL